MIINRVKLAIVTGIVTLFIGCGKTSEYTQEQTLDVKNETGAQSKRIEDIIIADHNVLSSTYMLNIHINVMSGKRIYFSLCDDYTVNNEGEIHVNYGSCLYRGSLLDGRLITEIKVANHNTKLIAAIWFYDDTATYYQIWKKSIAIEQSLTIDI